MKKSVIILIALIYIVSVALVSFFGLKAKVFDPIVYTESVELLNTGLKTNAQGGNYVVIDPDENGERKYQLLYRVHPDNATEDGVLFSYDKDLSFVTIDEDGVVTFTRKGVVVVEIIAKDGSGAKATITIFAR